MAKIKSEYKLPNPLVYRLSNPNYTIYHRAALGGLASTIKAWGDNQPQGITAQARRDEVVLSWDDEKLTDQDFLRILIENSFKLDVETKLIDLPGQRIGANRDDLRLAVHNGITATFLQHPKMRLGEKGSRKTELKTADEESGSFISYKAIDSFAHQKAQKTGLLDEKLKGNLPEVAAIQQWIVPGVAGGADELFMPTEEVILLLFLMVGSVVFHLRPRTFKEKAQACLIVPDVIDLTAFAKAVSYINAQNKDFERFSNSYLGRVVGGAEEAALRFLLDLQADNLIHKERKSVNGCYVIAMGKVAWDKNQVNRSIIARVRGDYEEINIFIAARQYLGKSKVIKTEKGDSFVIPSSPIPELVAANLAAERHWCFGFKTLVSEKKDFERMFYSIGGLRKMKDEIKDFDDRAVIDVFHEAWKFTMRNLYDRAESRNSNESTDLDSRRERIRNEVLRAKTADALSSWFLRFCADATKGGSLPAMRKNGERIRKFIFNPRNFERFQNLCLFALVSYAGKETATANQLQTQGEN
ncbi:MAG: type I-MYXAN CRISPR-associated Cas8a1/Cmx1 [Pyrinomonadaceae bacterium]